MTANAPALNSSHKALAHANARFALAAQVLLALALALPFVWPFDPGPSAKTGTMLLAAGLWSLTLIAAAAAGWLPRLGTAVWGFVALAAVIAAQTLAGRLAYAGQGWMAVLLLLGAARCGGAGLGAIAPNRLAAPGCVGPAGTRLGTGAHWRGAVLSLANAGAGAVV
jgi:hypothetical protein